MEWPYHFVSLSLEQLALRRVLLDRYGLYAHLSALIPVFAYQLYRLGAWVFSERQRARPGYVEVPSSLGSSKSNGKPQPSVAGVRTLWKQVIWWLQGEALPGWGLRGHWLAALAWASWLLFLLVSETGDDYLHLTKKAGIVGASQFLPHYMLSMKSLYSPLAFSFQTSHEKLNPYHRIMGRIIYSLLTLHATLYMNFFVQAGLVAVRLTQLVPLLGVLTFTLITILATTSLERVRRWSYRVFFICHLLTAVSILPILFFHATPIRLYLIESLILFVIDIVGRKFDTVTGFSTATVIANTNLVKLVIPIPEWKLGRFRRNPGQHVYLSIPAHTVPTNTSLPSIHELLHNPFTVADVSTKDITLVLRALNGPTTTVLKHLTKLSKAKPGINIEGPYGSARNFPDFASKFDRILLVAGGIGSTFILPIYHKIASSISNEGNNGASRVELIWAVKSLAEAGWAANTNYAEILNQDERVKLYVTGVSPTSYESSQREPGPEDSSTNTIDLVKAQGKGRVNGGYMRPNLQSIVENTFRQGGQADRTAVLVCGPAGLADELRHHVEKWGAAGRDIWWHDESFGW